MNFLIPRNGDFRLGRSLGVIALGLSLSLAPTPTRAESAIESLGRASFDLLVLRPLALGQTAVSVGVLPLGVPVGLVTGTTHEVIEICWTEPVERTFLRPLGEL